VLTGRELDATNAFYVAIRAPTSTLGRRQIHAFKEWGDAISHATRFQGSFVPNPLAGRTEAIVTRQLARPGAAGVTDGGRP